MTKFTTNYDRMIEDLLRYYGDREVDLAAKLGCNQSSISRWKNKDFKKGPSSFYADRIKSAYNELIGNKNYASDGPSEFSTIVPVMGRIGAGAAVLPEVEQIPYDGLYEVEVGSKIRPGSIAYEVAGDSMWPAFEDGDILIFTKRATYYEEPMGMTAAVTTVDGRRLVKILRPGSESGLYNLESHNAPPIRDVAVAVIWMLGHIIKKAEWRQIDREAKTRMIRNMRTDEKSKSAAAKSHKKSAD